MRSAFAFVFLLLLLTVSAEAQRNHSVLESKKERKVSTQSSIDNAASTDVSLTEKAVKSFAKAESAIPDSPLRILRKPSAKWPDQSRGSVCLQGSVLLRVEFLADGTIGKIAVVRGLPLGASENAIDAARKIKFYPKVKDGHKVNSFMTVEYSFSLY